MKEENAIAAESNAFVSHLEFKIQNSTLPPSPTAELARPRDRRGMVLLFLSAGLVWLILLASWAPDSRMTALRWVPGWLANWADRDPNLRTAIPFIPLAFLLTHGFRSCKLKWPAAWAVLLCGLCLLFSEFGQVFLPLRTADVRDLLWGGVGIAVGTGLAGILSSPSRPSPNR
jgi:VanZ like family